MGRPLRACQGGYVYHVLNRANGRLTLFHKDGDYDAFHRVLAEACTRLPMRVLCWCVMPNHRHLVLWPRADGEVSRLSRSRLLARRAARDGRLRRPPRLAAHRPG